MRNTKLHYKDPNSEISKLIEHPVLNQYMAIEKTSDNFRFAAAVAQFGMLLRNSEFKEHSSYKSVLALAVKAKGEDAEDYRKKFIELVKKASALKSGTDDIAYEEE